MFFFTKELWKGINGISSVYDAEIAEYKFHENIKKYNKYFSAEIVRVLTSETVEIYKKYDGFHDMEIEKLQYEQDKFTIYGKKVQITFDGVKELSGNFNNCIDTFGYMEILYRKGTDDLEIGVLFSWEDSIYIICSDVIARER